MRPIKDRAVASSSSTARPVIERMMAEACETIIQERHPASPPEWPEGTRTTAQGDQGCSGETEIMQEPPPPRRKTASTPRPERGGSPTRAEQGPVQAMFSPSPVVRKEKSSASHTYVPESESDGGGEPEDKRARREERHRLAARPTSDQKGDEEGAGPEQEEAMETEPSADLALAILNGLDISSLPALRDLSTGASTTVSIPWPPGWSRPPLSGDIGRFRLWRFCSEDGAVSGTATGAGVNIRKGRNAASTYQIPPHARGYGLPGCTTERCAGW